MLNDSFFDAKKNTLDNLYYKTTLSTLRLLSKFLKDNKNLNCLFLCRNSLLKDSRETKLTEKIFNNNKNFKILRRFNDNALWNSINESEIIISIDSTSLFDSIILRKKVIFMLLDFSKRWEYTPYNTSFKKFWPWVLTENSYLKFCKILNNLKNMSNKNFKNRVFKSMNYLSDDKKYKSDININKFIKSLV